MANRADVLNRAGPDLRSAWIDMSENVTLAATTAATTAALFPLAIIHGADAQLADGSYPGDSVPFATPVNRLKGGRIVFTAGLAAQTTLTLAVRVWRSFGTLAANITAAGGALTQLNLAGNGLNTALPSGQTFTVTNAAGTAQTWTTSAAAAAYATSVAVTSQTPSATYVGGTALVGVVGNTYAFGWRQADGGTPQFITGVAIAVPKVAANTALVTPPNSATSYLPLYPGDYIEVVEQTSTSTVAVPLAMYSNSVT